MHVFLVNDDGIGAEGIMALFHEAARRGHEVTMCAPRFQQSAASQRITLTEPIYVSEWPVDAPGCVAYSIAGTPTDCVRVGLQHLVKKPVDVVISGINNGYNAGMAVHYSGTVGAATEAALNRLPTIATSIHHEATPEMLAHLAAFSLDMAERICGKAMPPCTILNINAPLVEPGALKEPAYVPLDTGCFADGYEMRQSPRAGAYCWLESGCKMEPPTPGSDLALLEEGHITLTLIGNPVCCDRSVWEQLSKN